jgi:hypothetical protein
VGIRLVKVPFSATTISAKAFIIAYITVTKPAPNVLAVDVFWTVISHRHLALQKVPASYPAPPVFHLLSPLLLPKLFNV